MSKSIIEGKGWETWHDWQAKVMAPVTAFFCEASGVKPGHRALDTACGTGIPALDLALRALPNGRVTGVDISEEMVSAARRKAEQAKLTNIEFKTMDLAQLEFEDAAFDAVTCKDGLIYCPDPVAAARELRRVLAPNRRFAVSAWDEPGKNPFFTTLFRTVAEFVSMPRPAPDAPGPFRLSSPEKLAEVLSAAGFREFSVVAQQVVFEFDSVDMHWAVVRDMAAPMATAAAVLSDIDMKRLRESMAAAVSPYLQPNGSVRIPNTALCATGLR